MYNLGGQFNNPQSMYPFYPPFAFNYPRKTKNNVIGDKQKHKGQNKQPKTTNSNKLDKNKENKKPTEQQPQQPTEPQSTKQQPSADEVQDLGDQIYDYIENEMKLEDDELIGKITGVLLSSYDYYILREKYDKKEIRPVVDDIVENLKEQSN